MMPSAPVVDLQALMAALEVSTLERCRHLLTLADRTPYSASYGCFDRSYWQYKIKDFPSGMSQEALYPLALALEADLFVPLTPVGRDGLGELLQAAALASLAQQHRNGSVDDYFPFEQAAGATAFSLYAILAALETGQLTLPDAAWPRLRRRLHWLAEHRESGRLSNHEALISLCLAKAAGRLADAELLAQAEDRCRRLLSWRSPEGWFEEYGGFDVGYETLTFSCLLELQALLPGLAASLADLLPAHAALILGSLEPDGCLGGELYARGTWNCFAHGLLAHALAAGGESLPAVLRLLQARFVTQPVAVRDDYVLQHHLWSDLRCLMLLRQHAASSASDSPSTSAAPASAPLLGQVQVERSLPEAGHLWIRHGGCITHVSLRLGGAFRLYRDGRFVVQDTQNALKIPGRRALTLLAHAQTPQLRWSWQDSDTLVVEGCLSPYRAQPMTTTKLVVLRLLMLAVGRYWPDGIRRLMQRVLIRARSDRRRFHRSFQFESDGLTLRDCYELLPGEPERVQVIPTGFSTFRHVVMSRVFHPYALRLQAPIAQTLSRTASQLVLERRW